MRAEQLRLIANSADNGKSRGTQLGELPVLSRDPALLVCDPHFVKTASTLPVAGSDWSIRLAEVLVDERWRVAGVVMSSWWEEPTSWKAAVFADGSETFAVEHGIACVTNATGQRSLQENASLHSQFLRWVNGPPGCQEIESDEGDYCIAAWFGSGMGDGQYKCWWGMRDERTTTLVVDFELPLP